MILLTLLLIPIIGIFIIMTDSFEFSPEKASLTIHKKRETKIKFIGLTTSIFNLLISIIVFILFDFSSNQFQFVQEYYE